MGRHSRLRLLLCSIAAAATIVALDRAAIAASELEKISHIVVLYLENRSFDNLFGDFPGANGLAKAQSTDAARPPGHALLFSAACRRPIRRRGQPGSAARHHDGQSAERALRNRPHQPRGNHRCRDPGPYVMLFYTNRAQITAGPMIASRCFPTPMGLQWGITAPLPWSQTNLWKAARRGVLFDNFFQGAFGGSFLNHIWLVCACAPVWPRPPASPALHTR